MILKNRGYRRSVLTALGLGSLYERIDFLNSQIESLRSEAPESGQRIHLDYPVSPRVRYGWDRAPHTELARRISVNNAFYAALAGRLRALIPDLAKIKKDADHPAAPPWNNPWLSPFDAVSVYGMIALNKPNRFIEIGSGTTTKFARQAIKDHNLKTKIISIDPFPRSEIDSICDQIVRQPLENSDLSLFETVTPDDIIFFDGSHRSFQNSDVTVFFTEILPAVPSRTLVGVHDIFLPHDYPTDWLGRYYNEQYLLACWILAGDRLNMELPVYHCTKIPEIYTQLDELWSLLGVEHQKLIGGAMWFSMS